MDVFEQHRLDNNSRFKKIVSLYDLACFSASYIRRDVAKVNLPPGAKILDVACGTGSQSLAFAKRGFSVTGIDLSPEMLGKAIQKLKDFHAQLLCADAARMPFPDSSFDAVCISFGLHDMPETMAVEVLREMIRVAKPDGKIVIVDYGTVNNQTLAVIGRKIIKLWESQHFEHFSKIGLRHYLDQVGLKPEEERIYLFGYVKKVVCPIIKSVKAAL